MNEYGWCFLWSIRWSMFVCVKNHFPDKIELIWHWNWFGLLIALFCVIRFDGMHVHVNDVNMNFFLFSFTLIVLIINYKGIVSCCSLFVDDSSQSLNKSHCWQSYGLLLTIIVDLSFLTKKYWRFDHIHLFVFNVCVCVCTL